MTDGLQLRRFDLSGDDISALTGVVRRAYATLADRGLRYVGTWQEDDVTRSRIEDAECWCLWDGEVLAATAAFYGPDHLGGTPFYDQPGVATFGQLAVDPDRQGQGLGHRLLDHVEARARTLGAHEIACDTSEHADHLVALYTARGYRPVGTYDWDLTNYVSVLLSLKLGDPAR
ncbi:MAG: GNAT family N-acetyltransferase [Proteobacteria bacterium]|nr:GNAT family N-acetyltransferase [Pseudomonadota bacterium]